MRQRIASVIVLFNPEDMVIKTIQSLAKEGVGVVVVVNAATEDMLQKISQIQGVVVIDNGSNIGLAKALNLGIVCALEKLGARLVALFDQDSIPPPRLLSELSSEFIDAQLPNLACLGPRLLDIKLASASYVENNYQSSTSMPRSIPTSGSVISREAFYAVGPMREDFFIDGIDHEWCFRAYSKGFVVKVSDRAEMIHNMGDLGVNFFGQFKPIHRSPIRHYYIIRNTLYLIKVSYVPITWKITEILKTIRRFVAYLFVSIDSASSLRLMLLGMLDGISGRLGALDDLHPGVLKK